MKFHRIAMLAILPVMMQAGPALAADAPAAAAIAGGYSTKTPIETLVADPAAKAVIDQELPGLTAHEMFAMFKSMSLEDMAPMSGGQITPEKLVAVNAALSKLKAK
ncbi:hypothetical protein ACFB49_07350 [Sphingomonas sp. DBB INV C78]|uniref:hypothetical protein n=1 Tax=Sphingomonas sp. DBB INV C78 TaxID=3349434 RepID=UPI0036D417FB